MLNNIHVLLVILALLGMPTWGYSRSWGYGPRGGLGLIYVIVIVLWLLGVYHFCPEASAPGRTRVRRAWENGQLPPRHAPLLDLIGFDGDDTLWHSEGYYQAAGAEFQAILARYIDIADRQVQASMLATERRSLKLFGYGAKGMPLSMVETAIALTEARIEARDIHRIVQLGKTVLEHPVELLPGIRAAGGA